MSTTSDFKESVRAASTANINLAAPGAEIDGVQMRSGNRFLAKNQTTASENGIHVWLGAAYPSRRATDGDNIAEVSSGNLVYVEEGATNGADWFYLATANPIAVGQTALTFIKLGSGGGGADLAANNTWTGENTFGNTVTLDGDMGGVMSINHSDLNWSQTASTDQIFNARQDGDTYIRLQVLADGTISWGDGSTSLPDTNLYRSDGNSLKTDSQFEAGGFYTLGDLNIGDGVIGTPLYSHFSLDANDMVYRTLLDGEAYARFSWDGAGAMTWSDGTATPDAFLSYDGAGGIEIITTTGDLTFFPGGDTVFNQTATFNEPVDLNSNVSIGDGPTRNIGFYGAAAIPQQGAPTTLGDVITILQNLGLCE